MTSKPYFPVWKTINIGIHQELEEEIKGLDPGATDLAFIEPILQKKYTLDPDAFDIIQKPAFIISKLPKTIQLVETFLRSLGLPNGICYNVFLPPPKRRLVVRSRKDLTSTTFTVYGPALQGSPGDRYAANKRKLRPSQCFHCSSLGWGNSTGRCMLRRQQC